MAILGNPQSVDLLGVLAIPDARNDLLVMRCRPVDTDEFAAGIIARFLPVPCQAAIGATEVGAFRSSGQENQTLSTGGYDASGSRPTPAQSPRPWKATCPRVCASPESQI